MTGWYEKQMLGLLFSFGSCQIIILYALGPDGGFAENLEHIHLSLWCHHNICNVSAKNVTCKAAELLWFDVLNLQSELFSPGQLEWTGKNEPHFRRKTTGELVAAWTGTGTRCSCSCWMDAANKTVLSEFNHISSLQEKRMTPYHYVLMTCFGKSSGQQHNIGHQLSQLTPIWCITDSWEIWLACLNVAEGWPNSHQAFMKEPPFCVYCL